MDVTFKKTFLMKQFNSFASEEPKMFKDILAK